MPNEQRHYSNELNLESVGINLPYNMQAEQSVLGAVLLKPETLTDLVEIIRPEMFYTRQNAQIYSEMLRLFTSDQTIDFVTLVNTINVYDVMKAKTVVLTKDAVAKIEEVYA
jgi:replicative DNA helicase